MSIQRSTVYAWVSIACPFVFGIGMETYQQIQNAGFWTSLGRDETSDMAGALFAFTEVIQFIFVLLLGCIIGVIFAIISIVKARKILSIGFAGGILNSLPFIAFLALLLFRK